jgi:aspartyl-tRNA(Asn)/glutamyl-tRNA(Gln) amidotransferase subunit A
VATAAGLCAFAIGTDTGGSVRLPAHFCGTFGLKTTAGLWPTDGVFPLARDLDSIGPLTRSAADAAVVFAVLTGQPAPTAHPVRGLRLGKPVNYFYDNLDAAVETGMAAALAKLEQAGADIVPIEVPEAPEREKYFPAVLPADLISVLGRDRFLAGRARMDSVVAARGGKGLDVMAAEVLQLKWGRQQLCSAAEARFEGLDGWVTPTAAVAAVPVDDFNDLEKSMRLTLGITQDTQPGNLLGLCATTTPVQMPGAALPVGLQILCPANREARALAIALAIEDLVGLPPRPDLGGFLP